MKILNIQSGSKGNATIIESDGCLLLIDMGISLSNLIEALESIGKRPIDLDALLVTHSHCDHTSGIRYLDPLPIFCTTGTWEANNVNYVSPFEEFMIKNIKVTPIEASHDAKNTIGYILEDKNSKFVYLTDTGYIPQETLNHIKNADYYMIEANHDRKMLLQTNRPRELKLRILSDVGHLSNEDSAMYMSQVIGDCTKEIILSHLSEEANTPDKALDAYQRIFDKKRIKLDKIYLHCANQYQSTVGGDCHEL